MTPDPSDKNPSASTILSEERQSIKKPPGWCMEDDLNYYADWRHVKYRHLTSQQLKACLEQMQRDRETSGTDTQKHIDWWQPIYEDHLRLTLSKEIYDAKMSWWHSKN